MVPRIVRPSPCTLALVLALSLSSGTKHNFPRPVFVYTLHPDVPIERFAAGQIGLPEPRHARIYLFAAYRYLDGNPFTAAERARWLNVWKSRANRDWPETKVNQTWRRARASVPHPLPPTATAVPAQVPFRDYITTSVCSDDAFTTAANTLAGRVRRYGAASAEVKFWVTGQDAVFAVCASAAPQQLAVAPASMPALIRADRDYQIAAATLYAQHFDEAAALFRRIAQDPASPWRAWAPYQTGRALLYKARQTQDDKTYITAVAAAEAQFRSVLATPALRVSHTAAEYLLLRCMMITNRRAAVERIGSRLLRGNWQETDLSLYLNALDEYGEALPSQWPRDAVSQWILSFQRGQAIRQPRSPAWLYAALWLAKPAEATALAGAAIENGAAPLRYLAARHFALTGRLPEARQLMATVLEEWKDLPSARNRALQLHSLLAESWDQYLERAPRAVIFASSEMNADEWESESELSARTLSMFDPPNLRPHRQQYIDSVEYARKRAAERHWDETAVTVLNEYASLRVLARAALSDTLPAALRDELARAAFTRAVLLNRWDVAKSLAARVNSPAMPRFLEKPSEFTAALVLLSLPGARPGIRFGYGRDLPPAQHDADGRNWWFSLKHDAGFEFDLPYIGPGRQPDFTLPAPPLFASPEEAREAAQEWQILRRSGEMGLNWIAAKIVDAVNANPRRPDAPELLYRVIVASRTGWWSSLPTDIPHQHGLDEAARLLSSRYRSSKWFREMSKWETWQIPASAR